MSNINKEVIQFNAYDSNLEEGINLIEASAGTGKTFSIAMLVARFILQENFTIDQILVVTFTNAAAQELRDRIRARLVEIKAVISEKPSDDQALNQWVANLQNLPEAKILLINALADIDSAHIFTIHSFCQRILSQYALESGQVFGAELLQNDIPLRQQIAEDYWRLQTYARPIQQVGLLRSIAKTPYELLKFIDEIQGNSILLPKRVDLDDCLHELDQLIIALKPVIPTILATLQRALENEVTMFKPKFVDGFLIVRQRIEHWLNLERSSILKSDGVTPVDALLELTTQSFYSNALNGVKFRKTKALTAEERKQAFLEEQGIDLLPLEPLNELLSTLKIAFKQSLYEYLNIEQDKRLTKNNQLSFDGMIKRLASAVSGISPITGKNQQKQAFNEGQDTEHLKRVLQNKFPVAMIDEFQDTDDAQWSIFASLAENHNNYLYLIGDPKQAIYRFRGADIYSYLSAQEKSDRKYNLGTNWRSQPTLVEAVNTLFDVEKPFLIEPIEYLPVDAASKKRVLTQDNKAFEKMVLWVLDKNPDHKDGYWLSSKGQPKEQVRTHVVNEILNLLNINNQVLVKSHNYLTDHSKIEKKGDHNNKPLSPVDIAILVRSNPEAEAYQQALADHGLPSVLNSKISVLSSSQAEEIYHILNAVLRAGNLSLMRYALCQPWFGLNGNDLHSLQDQQQQMDDWIISFQLYHERWEKKGLLAMMQTLMDDKGVVRHLAKYRDVERRLTNINHILELLQEVAIGNRLSMIKTMQWLEDAMQGRVVAEGQELRLESDENAINIVTIHSSKGLEYPVVFCPDLWAKARVNKKDVAVFHRDGQQISDIGSDHFDEHLQLTQYEDQAEELRLLYVAVTRAKYRCYVAWADQRTLKDENQSAFAYLLKQRQGDDWIARMTDLCTQKPKVFEYQLLEVDKEIKAIYHQPIKQNLFSNKELKRQIKTKWMMSSYSALAYHSLHESVPELPLDKSQEQETSSAIEIPDNVSEEQEVLPKGAHTGNLVHELLEYTEFSVLANLLDDENYVKNRTEMIKRFAVNIDDESILDQLLQNTVKTALTHDDPEFILANLNESQCLKEMPFYFAVEQLNTLEINQLLKHSKSYLPLTQQQIQGQLTGFIDLICEYQGRYYVMDYKTNSLADYSIPSMTESMREHNYGLQYWLYSLVLHRYLQQRLPEYDFNIHFGGVRYLFVRGMNPSEPMSGVFQDQPDLVTIEALSIVFS